MASPRALELAERLWQWKPHSEGQREWLLCDASVKIGACGRRWGKSESMAVDIVLYALENPGHIQILIAPTDDQTSIIMDDVERRLYSIPGLVKCFTHTKSPYTEIKFKDGKGLMTPTIIMARTAGTTGKGLRGRKAHRVIVDEAAFVGDNIMMNVVAPLLADFDGKLVEISTPDGRNHFFQSFQRGNDPEEPRYRSFRFPSKANPYISSGYLETQERVLPERSWKQEYEAEFLDLAGAVFRKVHQAATGLMQGPKPGHQYIFGVDWARSRDFTVIVVIDITERRVVWMDRFNQIDFKTQRTRLYSLYEKYRPVSIVAEQNSIGLPNIEALQRDYNLPILAFNTTNASKAAAVDALVLALEQESLVLLNDPAMIGELLAFEAGKTKTGLPLYGAPEGMHDDIVMALCLAVWGMGSIPEAPLSGGEASTLSTWKGTAAAAQYQPDEATILPPPPANPVSQKTSSAMKKLFGA